MRVFLDVDEYWPKRRHPRHAVTLSVLRSDADGLEAHAVNVSAGGACIVTPAPVPAGSHHDFSFVVPDGRNRGTLVSVSAMVAWSSRGVMGICFVGRYEALEDFIERLARSQVGP